MNVTSRRHILKASTVAAGSLFPLLSATPQTRGTRNYVDLKTLKAKPVTPSVDLFLAMNVQAFGLIEQMTSGEQNYESLTSGANLMRTYATQLHHMEIDDLVRSLAKERIGKRPPAPPSDLTMATVNLFLQYGIRVNESDISDSLRQSQESHDTAHALISRIGASGVYHSFADMLEAGSSEMYKHRMASGILPTVYDPDKGRSTGRIHKNGHLLLVAACSTPPPPPWYCPSAAIIEAIGAAMTGVGTVLAAAFGTALANLDSLAFCTTVAAASLTGDAASEGAGLIASPFEYWLCENSQAITAGLQKALSAPGAQTSVSIAGAAAGAYLYGQLKTFLKDKGCSV